MFLRGLEGSPAIRRFFACPHHGQIAKNDAIEREWTVPAQKRKETVHRKSK
jgi:hypothetical protein